MKKHLLKLETKFFQDVEKGKKCFEVRRNDRDFKIGDVVMFKEIVYGNDPLEIETGRKTGEFVITYIFYGWQCMQFGVDRDFCVFQMEAINL